MHRRSLLALVTAAALGGAVGGCVTPSIPIPPPEPERMTFTVDVQAGVAIFEYGPEPNYADAVVYVFNRDRGQGVITTARPDGSVGPTDPFPAAVGDRVAVTFETTDSIAGTCVQINSDGSAGFCN
ncbi:MAG TPA: hypothetical protein VM261_08930 [Kofleriaceae bacterium]|nr:hypothetical protein [Kofleriaceae bacterium]